MPILGIDLGTTNSLVGVVDAGFPILLADEHGARLTPSAVYFPPDGQPIVGRAALRQRALHPRRTVTSVKRLIGKRVGEIEASHFAYPLVGAAGSVMKIGIEHAGQAWQSPEEISALILRRLRDIATAAMGYEINRAIITVPAYFNDAQRNATKRAGELAGLTVERILNEPTAAALSFGLHRAQDRAKIVVYDLGGGTFDVSILEIQDGVFHVLATNGDTFLGGDDIDHALAEFLWGEFAQHQSALGQQAAETQIKFRQVAETAKIALSGETEFLVSLPFAVGERHFEYALSRVRLETLAKPIVERTRRHCLQALADAKLETSQLDHVVVVGGSTRMPLVRELVGQFFGREANTSENPDESIALGAVIQGGILAGELRNLVLLDVTPLSLGIESFGGLMNVIIPRNTTIPTKAGEMFTNAVANQDSMLLRVLQGEREMARDNWELGRCEVPFTPGPKASARVGVQFALDQNGILQVLARDTATGQDTVLEITSAAVDVADEKVERMISESVDHAFADMGERIFTEAKLKADELLPAVDQALAAVGEQLPAVERESIQRAAEEVRQALASGNPHALKAATGKLDEATQALAARLVERAMEESLARQGLVS